MHMIEVSCASEENLSHERRVYNLADIKMVRYCQKCALVHVTISENVLNAFVFGQLCISEMNVSNHAL